MPVAFTPVITAAGVAAAIAADGSGLDLHITHVALGSGKYTPTGSETALVNRREKATILPGSSSGPAQFTVLATFTGYVGTAYEAGEVGFYAGDPDAGGVLFAVASRPAPDLFALRSPSVDSYTAEFACTLTGVPTGSVVVDIDPSALPTAGLLDQYVRKDGTVPMTGPLTLSGNATNPLHAVPLQQLASAMVFAALANPNGYIIYPLGGGIELVLQWVNVSIGDPPASPSTGSAVPFTWPRALDERYCVVPGIIGDGSGANVFVQSPTLRGGILRATEWTDYSQSITGQVIVIGKRLPPAVPVANFTKVTTSEGSSFANVSFTDTSSGHPDTWLWNFGDGNTSTLRDPAHSYDTPGSYTVTLTASNSLGSDAEVKTAFVVVAE